MNEKEVKVMNERDLREALSTIMAMQFKACKALGISLDDDELEQFIRIRDRLDKMVTKWPPKEKK